MKSCLLCGVGGQGTVLASRIIAAASMQKGLFARTAETIGMAQRGGCVVSHVRVGESVPSPMIPPGQADVIIGFEPGEAVRCLNYLKPGGTVIVCSKEVQPITASLAGTDYSGADMIAFLKKHVEKCYVLDPDMICRECGSSKVINVALMGAMAASGAMDLTLEDVEKALELKVRPQFLEMNKKALRLGADCI
jgi:indolepyruvate ferredoxin oxidoreductase beta subunit